MPIMSQVEQFTQSWLSHRDVLDLLLAQVKDEDLSFKPWDGAMSLGELALHIAQSAEFFINAAKTGEFNRSSDRATASTVAELRVLVQQATDRSKAVLDSLADADLGKLVATKAMFGTDLPAIAVLNSMKDHEIHHKGQLFVYVRMTGAKELPFFVKPRA